MLIKEVEISSFRSIKHQVITNIENILVLIGKNNSGKSALLQAINAFWGNYNIDEDDFYKNKDTIANEIEIRVVFYIDESFYSKVIDSEKLGIKFFVSTKTMYNKNKEKFENKSYEEIEQLIENKNYDEIIKYYGDCINDLLKISDSQFSIKMKYVKGDKSPKYYNIIDEEIKSFTSILPGISFIDDDRNFLEEENCQKKSKSGDIFNNLILNIEKQSISSNLNKIYKKNTKDLTVNDLKMLLQNKVQNDISNIENTITTIFNENYSENLKIKYESDIDLTKSINISTKMYNELIKNDIRVSNVGAGIRSIYILSLLQAYNDVFEKSGNIFLIEEPELYLHPELQIKMAEILYEISKTNQVIYTTHTTMMTNNINISQIRKVTYEQPTLESNYGLTTIDEIIKELGYSTKDILNVDFVFLLEGKQDVYRLKMVIEKFYDVDVNRISFVACNSCSNLKTFATLKFLECTTWKENFAIIRDMDSKREDILINEIIEKCKSHSIDEDVIKNKLLITKYNSMEGYFCDINIIKKISEKSDEELRLKIIQCLDKNKIQILQDIKNKNSNDISRYKEIEDTLYNMRSNNFSELYEEIKKFVRGHNLYNVLELRKIQDYDRKYIFNSDEEIFTDILEFLDKQKFFKEKRKDKNGI